MELVLLILAILEDFKFLKIVLLLDFFLLLIEEDLLLIKILELEVDVVLEEALGEGVESLGWTGVVLEA